MGGDAGAVELLGVRIERGLERERPLLRRGRLVGVAMEEGAARLEVNERGVPASSSSDSSIDEEYFSCESLAEGSCSILALSYCVTNQLQSWRSARLRRKER